MARTEETVSTEETRGLGENTGVDALVVLTLKEGCVGVDYAALSSWVPKS